MNETYIEPEETSLKQLYAYYYGEEIDTGKDNKIWKNKTLEQ